MLKLVVAANDIDHIPSNARNKYFYICVPSLATLSPVVIIPAVVHILANRRLKKPVSRLNTSSTKKIAR